jgi:hypothetical protein
MAHSAPVWITRGLVLVVLVAPPVTGAGRQAPEPSTITIQLLALNDFHGNLEPPAGSTGVVNRHRERVAERLHRVRERRAAPGRHHGRHVRKAGSAATAGVVICRDATGAISIAFYNPAYVARLRNSPWPGRPRNLSPSTTTRPRESTASGIPVTLMPSNIE